MRPLDAEDRLVPGGTSIVEPDQCAGPTPDAADASPGEAGGGDAAPAVRLAQPPRRGPKLGVKRRRAGTAGAGEDLVPLWRGRGLGRDRPGVSWLGVQVQQGSMYGYGDLGTRNPEEASPGSALGRRDWGEPS